MNIVFFSRHDLSPAQRVAIRALHGEDATMEKREVVFDADPKSLAAILYWMDKNEIFAYVVAPAPHLLYAAFEGYCFGLFTNHPAKRADGSFGLDRVYHVLGDGYPQEVYRCPDPLSDEGETLR